jgi:hypothetical protein
MLDDQTLILGTNTGHRSECRELWAAVLICNLNDAAGHLIAAYNSKQGSREALQRQAKAWIGTSDFRHVCALAGIDHTAVQAAWDKGVFPIKGGSAGRSSQIGKGRAAA